MTTAFEQLQALHDQVPIDAQPKVDEWLKAIEASRPITVLQEDSERLLQEILAACPKNSPLALRLHVVNEAIQAA